MSLSPSGVAPVCLGDLLTVTCRAEGLSNTDFIRWNIASDVDGRSENEERFLSAAGQTFIAPITLNMITFNLTLEADTDGRDMTSITVTSNLSVNVAPLLNEAVIRCSAITQNSAVVGPQTTNIRVITSDTGKWRLFYIYAVYIFLVSCIVSLSVFEDVVAITNDNITVILSWPQEFGVSYDVHVVPSTMLNFTTTTSIQLTMSYHVSYTVTIVGSQCDLNVSRAVEELRYGELISRS